MEKSTYPESPEAVLRILNAYQPPPGWNKRWQEAGAASKEGAMFAQTSNKGDNSLKSQQTCYKCGERGHIAQECPLREEKQDQMHATIEEDEVVDVEKLMTEKSSSCRRRKEEWLTRTGSF